MRSPLDRTCDATGTGRDWEFGGQEFKVSRIAVYDGAGSGWTASSVITETLVRALHGTLGDKDSLIVLTENDPAHWRGVAPLLELPKLQYRRGEVRIRAALHAPPRRGSPEYYLAKEQVTTVLLPTYNWVRQAPYKRIPWIPDFQHRHLPENFTAKERSQRDGWYYMAAKHADKVLLMSNAVLADFQRFIPDFADKGRVFIFPSLFAYTEVPKLDPSLPAAYGVPAKFILVANQYWSHKNHGVVLEALEQLKARGMTIPVVFTGLPLDYRDGQNAPTSTILQGIARRGLGGIVIPLGLVPRTDLVNLMRCAAAVLQPSLFEGWGLSVQEAVALGRPTICSDIPALRENAPDALGFFAPSDPRALAGILERVWPSLAAGPDLGGESAALDRQRAFGKEQGKALLALCG
jgi:glycosyltransferase involved in cell wall biosynthesis